VLSKTNFRLSEKFEHVSEFYFLNRKSQSDPESKPCNSDAGRVWRASLIDAGVTKF